MDIKQREGLVHQAETAYINLMGQLDNLFECANFYLQRYPSDGSPSAELVSNQLISAVNELGVLPSMLGEVIKRWKHGEERILSVSGVELHILNELWANIMALVYFFLTRQIDLHPFSLEEAKTDWTILKRANQLLA